MHKKIILLVAICILSVLSAFKAGGEDKKVTIEDMKIEKEFDIIVFGTDPEGIAAAVSASRLDQKVLLVDKRERLGGLFTLGGLNSLDMNYNPEKELLTKGLFEEFFKRVDEKTSFNTHLAEKAFNDMVNEEKNITLLLGKEIQKIEVKENKIEHIKYKDDPILYKAKVYIDTTQDGDIAYLTGVPYTTGMEDAGVKGRKQVATLVFEVAGVDYEKIYKHLRADGDYHTGADETSAWGFLNEMKGYKSLSDRIRLRGLNIGKEDDGKVLINAMHIFGVDPLSEKSKSEAIELAKTELVYVIEYMRENIVGFENAYLSKTMEELYIRESRHIDGEYKLTINDVLENKNFDDKIALGSYPIDIQPTSIHDWGTVIGTPKTYSIPIRCIVPKKIENLLVASRASSYTSLAHGTTRVVPVGMVVAEAASVTAFVSIYDEISLRDLAYSKEHISKVQEILKLQGANLNEFSYPSEYDYHWTIEGTRMMFEKGFVSGGYSNDYKLGNKMKYNEFENLFRNFSKYVYGRKLNTQFVVANNKFDFVEKDVIASILTTFAENKKENFEYLYKNGYIKEVTYNKLKNKNKLLKAEVYMMVKEFADYLGVD
ncbi:MAG: FAD-dependent oxidoreductase [Clostridia bacterium]|jgi:hypothetical protein|nr:FAD-dependent oxidoreductase [Clostridia bacterium]